MLSPDAEEMDRAIMYHAEWHAGKEEDPEKAKAIFEQAQNCLIERVLEAAGEE